MGYFTFWDKLLQILFESLLFIGLVPLCIITPLKASVALVFSEYVELVNLLKLLKKYHVKELYYYSIFEKDSNISSIAIQKMGIKITKVTYVTPIQFYNNIIVATDTLALCDVNQIEELKFFPDTIQFKNIELWGPYDVSEVSKYYESYKKGIVKNKNIIRFKP